MKKLIYFQIIVFIVCLSQVSFGAGYRNILSSSNNFSISGTNNCGLPSTILFTLPLIRITSKTTAILFIDPPSGGTMQFAGTINNNVITFAQFNEIRKCNSNVNLTGAVPIKFTFTFTNGQIGSPFITGTLSASASGAVVGSGFKSGIVLTYFNGNSGEATEKANAVVFSPSGTIVTNPSNAIPICTRGDNIRVEINGDNYQGVQLYLDGTPLGNFVPTDNAFSVTDGNITFTMESKNISNDGIHTISLDVNGTRTTYATFQTYTPISNTNRISPSNPISCYGNPVSLNVNIVASDRIQYGWNDGVGGPNQATISVTNNFSKKYSITMSRPNQTCEVRSNEVSIQVIDFNPTVSPNKTQACEGQTIQLSASPNDGTQYNFEWSNGSKDNNIFVPDNNGGKGYSVKITPKNGGCDSKSSNTVNNLVFEKGITGDKISITNKTSAIFCKDETNITLTATADGGVAGLGFQWGGTKSGTGDKLQVESGGVYTLQLSKGDCRTTPKTITVIGKIIPTFSLNPSDAQICKGQKMSLSTTNNANYTYQWFGGADGKTDLKVNSANYDATDGGLYRVVLNPNGGNCNATTGVYEVSQQVKADEPVNAVLTPSGNAVICNDKVGIDLLATGTGSGIIYNWNTGVASTSINVKTAGTYSVTLSRGKCNETKSVITKVEPLTVSISPTKSVIVCSGSNYQAYFLEATSNYTDAKIKWKLNNNTTDAPESTTDKRYAPKVAGNIYAFAEVASLGCTSPDPSNSVKVEAVSNFNVSIDTQYPVPTCDGLINTFTAKLGYTSNLITYEWLQNNGIVSTNKTNTIGANANGVIYTVNIQQEGCKATATTTFTTKASKPSITVVDNLLIASLQTDSHEWLLKPLPASTDPNQYKSLSPSETKDRLEAPREGSYILKGNRNGCGIAFSTPVDIYVLANENTNSNTWKVYPNPSNDVVTIENNSLDFLQSNVIELRNNAGILVKYLFQSEKSKEYNVNDLSAGTYHLIFKQKNSTIIKKIIKL